MSKSKANLIMVSDLFKKYSPNAIRWLILSNHWSKSWEYKEEDLMKAQKNVELVENAIASQGVSLEPTWSDSNIEQFCQILGKNLDAPKALQFLLKLTKQKIKGFKNLYNILGFK